MFLAGLAGASSLLAAIADATRPAEAERVVRRGRYLPLLAPTIGAALLIWDLHTPKRFYNMFRIAKGTSPMSIGTWILTGFSLSSMASAALQFLSDRVPELPWLRRWSQTANLPAAALGAGMSTYTGALLAATSTPLWAAAPRALAARFGAASVASGAAALSLPEPDGPAARALDTVAAVALLAELAIDGVQAVQYRRKGVSAALSGPWGLAEKLGATGLGAALPLGLLVMAKLGNGNGRGLPRLASVLALGGSFLFRVSIMEAGDAPPARRRSASASRSRKTCQRRSAAGPLPAGAGRGS